MPFSRREPALFEGKALDAALRSIGVRVSGPVGTSPPEADIELTLASAARAAMPNDYRLLGLLVAWLEMHHKHVLVPKLVRLAARSDLRPITRAWWSAVGAWLGREDARWRVLEKLYQGAALDLDDPEVTTLQLRRLGADPRFVGTALRVHQKLLRARASDVEDPVSLASQHRLYRKRVEFGANYRADVWAAMDTLPDATPAEVARAVGCAYETARSVAEDWHTAKAAARRETAA